MVSIQVRAMFGAKRFLKAFLIIIRIVNWTIMMYVITLKVYHRNMKSMSIGMMKLVNL